MLFPRTNNWLPRVSAFLAMHFHPYLYGMLPQNGSNPIFDLCFTNTHFSVSMPINNRSNTHTIVIMGEEAKSQNFKHHHRPQSFPPAMEQESDDHHHPCPCSSVEEASTISNGSSSSTCSSFDTTDDASSSPSSSSANSSRSSLYDLSDLMSQLPIKRGLSQFYHGKSDSFTSLARVTSVEDLAKKEKNPYKFRSHTLPKPIISKKNSRKKKLLQSKQIHGGWVGSMYN